MNVKAESPQTRSSSPLGQHRPVGHDGDRFAALGRAQSNDLAADRHLFEEHRPRTGTRRWHTRLRESPPTRVNARPRGATDQRRRPIGPRSREGRGNVVDLDRRRYRRRTGRETVATAASRHQKEGRDPCQACHRSSVSRNLSSAMVVKRRGATNREGSACRPTGTLPSRARSR